MSLVYSVSLANPNAHEIKITLDIENPDPQGQRLTLPAWIPGSYMIRDFAKNILSLKAYAAAQEISATKLDKQSWLIDPCDGILRVEYRVYAWDLSVRAAHFDNTHAYFNGTSVFLRVLGHEGQPHNMKLLRPDNDLYRHWCVSTSMPCSDAGNNGFTEYQTGSYAELIDYPVEIGDQEELQFTVQGVQHRIAVSEGGVFDQERILRDLEKICAEHASMYCELPVKRYLFLVLATPDGYGGLEHSDSTSLMCKRADLPAYRMNRPTKGYRQFLGLCSHEYFHLWNVKRIKPQRLATADLSTEVHTELLWAFEGITSYYDELALARCGCLEMSEYLDLLATTVTRVQRGYGRFRQSVAESSFDSWSKFYKQDENAPNAIVSYYAKGALVALGLDVELRERSANGLSLDDLMRALWADYGKTLTGVGEKDIEKLAEQLLGESLQAFFSDYVHGTRELPLAKWFSSLGIGYRLRPAVTLDDLGGFVDKLEEARARVVLGARYTWREGGLLLQQVFQHQSAQLAGLAPGDVLLAIDEERVNEKNIDHILNRHPPGTELSLHYFRRGRMHQGLLPTQLAVDDTCDLSLLAADEMSPQQQLLQRDWMASSQTNP